MTRVSICCYIPLYTILKVIYIKLVSSVTIPTTIKCKQDMLEKEVHKYNLY